MRTTFVKCAVGLSFVCAAEAYAQSWYDHRSGLTWSLYSNELTWDQASSWSTCSSLGSQYRLPTVNEFRYGSDVLRSAAYQVGALGSYLWTRDLDNGDYSLARAFRVADQRDYPLSRNTAIAVACVAGPATIAPPTPVPPLPVPPVQPTRQYYYDHASGKQWVLLDAKRDWQTAWNTCASHYYYGRSFRLPNYSEVFAARPYLSHSSVGAEIRRVGANQSVWTSYEAGGQAYLVQLESGQGFYDASWKSATVLCVSQ